MNLKIHTQEYPGYCHQENRQYRERQILIHWPSCTPKGSQAYEKYFVALLFTVVHTQNLPRDMLVDKWRQCGEHTQWRSIFLFKKKNEIMPFTGKGSELGVILVSWRCRTQREEDLKFSLVPANREESKRGRELLSDQWDGQGSILGEWEQSTCMWESHRQPHYFHIVHRTPFQRCLRLVWGGWVALLTGTLDCVDVPAAMVKKKKKIKLIHRHRYVIITFPSLSLVSIVLPSTCHCVLGDMWNRKQVDQVCFPVGSCLFFLWWPFVSMGLKFTIHETHFNQWPYQTNGS